MERVKAQKMCESGGGRPGPPVRNSPPGLSGRKAKLNSWRERERESKLRSCVKMEVDVLGSASLVDDGP